MNTIPATPVKPTKPRSTNLPLDVFTTLFITLVDYIDLNCHQFSVADAVRGGIPGGPARGAVGDVLQGALQGRDERGQVAQGGAQEEPEGGGEDRHGTQGTVASQSDGPHSLTENDVF